MSDDVDEIVEAAERRRETLRGLRDSIRGENRVKGWAWSTFCTVARWLATIAPELIPLAIRFLQGDDVSGEVSDIAEEALPDVSAVVELIDEITRGE